MKVIVIGAGKVGFEISLRLSEEKHDIVVIDQDPDALKEISGRLDVMSIPGNGASPAVLEQAGIDEARILVAVTEVDEVNMIACMTAKQYGVETCVARIRKPEYMSGNPRGLSLNTLGIDLVMDPERLAALEISRLLKTPMATDVEYFADGRVSLIGLKVSSEARIAGKSLADLKMPNCLIVAVARDEQVLIPRGDTIVKPGDRLFVVGRTGNFHPLRALAGNVTQSIQSVGIVGAGRIGRHIIDLLAPQKRSSPTITLFEKDSAKAHQVAKHFPDLLVIEGDATKIDVLRDEGAQHFDALVAVSGQDDTNLLATMVAKQLGVSEVITEISREDYAPLALRAGADAVVVPRLLTVSSVLKLVRESEIISIAVLEGGAEALEFVATQGCRITGRQLREISFPRGALVGAILQGNSVIIPKGSSTIEPQSRVIVFALPEAIDEVSDFFRVPYRSLRTLAPSKAKRDVV